MIDYDDDGDGDDNDNDNDDDDDEKKPKKNVEVRTRVTACSPWRHPALRRHPCDIHTAILGPLPHVSLQYSLYIGTPAIYILHF